MIAMTLHGNVYDSTTSDKQDDNNTIILHMLAAHKCHLPAKTGQKTPGLVAGLLSSYLECHWTVGRNQSILENTDTVLGEYANSAQKGSLPKLIPP